MHTHTPNNVILVYSGLFVLKYNAGSSALPGLWLNVSIICVSSVLNQTILKLRKRTSTSCTQ